MDKERGDEMGNLSLKKFTQFALVIALVYLGVSYLPDIMGFSGSVLSAAAPLLLGCVIAYVLNILMVRLEALYFPGSQKPLVQKSRRAVCILLAFETTAQGTGSARAAHGT